MEDNGLSKEERARMAEETRRKREEFAQKRKENNGRNGEASKIYTGSNAYGHIKKELDERKEEQQEELKGRKSKKRKPHWGRIAIAGAVGAVVIGGTVDYVKNSMPDDEKLGPFPTVEIDPNENSRNRTICYRL